MFFFCRIFINLGVFGAIREGREVHTVNTKGESIYFFVCSGFICSQ